MKKHISILGILILTLSLAVSISADTAKYDVNMTIRQIAHDVGLKGRELAELLELEGSVDKDTALLELNISQQQLDTALEGVAVPEEVNREEPADITTAMTLQEAAHAMGINGKELAHDLSLPIDADKQTPLKELGVNETTLAEAVRHAAHEKEGEWKWLKYPLWLLICGFGVFLLVTGRTSKALYLSTLTLALAVTGFTLGKAPNPMESVVKVFKAAVGIFPDSLEIALAFAFFCVLAIIGNKIICGWGCPFGALQELLFETPLGDQVKRLRRKKLPFKWTHLIRTAIFTAFVLFVLGVIGGKKGFVIYHYINPFNLFDFEFALISVVASITAFILLSPFVYRSFCQFICPFGLISWVLEKVSLSKIRINREKCTECMACVAACPLEAMRGRMADSGWPADCFSCARCLRSCNDNALDYKAVWDK
jgi:NAD-dependent dihydropyrimidine dehydrogenase PreA subunit